MLQRPATAQALCLTALDRKVSVAEVCPALATPGLYIARQVLEWAAMPFSGTPTPRTKPMSPALRVRGWLAVSAPCDVLGCLWPLIKSQTSGIML